MLTENGFEIKRLPEILADLAAKQKAIFPSLNLDPSTPDGQLNGQIGDLIYSVYATSLAIYNGMDPRTAKDIMLKRIGAIGSIPVLGDSPTSVQVKFTGPALTLIPSGTVVASSVIDNITFSTIADVTIESGATTAQALAEASEVGAIPVLAGEIDEIVSGPAALTAVTNDTAGTTGRLDETDEQYRIRREKSVAINSQSLPESVYSKVAAVEGVTDIKVYQNRESIVVDTMNPNSIWIIVKGGLDPDIAEAIMTKISLACGMKGSEEVAWVDRNGNTEHALFDRPTDKGIHVQVDASSPTWNSGYETEIKNKIVAYVEDVRNGTATCATGSFSIGDPVYASSFYPAIIGSPDYTISNILVGSSTPAGDQVVALDLFEISAFDVANITVTVI
jgi:uncharacterized phage protein gp47/JayE